MKKRHFMLSVLLLITLAVAVIAQNTVITRRLPEFEKDNRGMKALPVVVYNASTENYETVYVATDASGSIPVVDGSYSNKVSTETAGKLSSTQTISPTMELVNWTYYSKGGQTTLKHSWGSGIVYVPADAGLSGSLPVPEDSPDIIVDSIDSGTTLYYVLNGVR
jgi:hypothetical protein